MLKEAIIRLPGFILRPIRYIYGIIPDYIRYGRTYRKQYNFLKKSQWWTIEQHDKYQMEQIKRLLKHAYDNVPYYTRVFDERGIRPEDINRLEDVKKLPYLTKDLVRENLEDLIAKNYDRKRLKCLNSGGTTALPMPFYVDDKLRKAIEWAHISNLWERAGYTPRKACRYVILRGNMPENGLYQYKGRDLIISSFKLSEENIKQYIKLIENFNPDFIQAYPSSIHLLAKYILKNNIKLNIGKLKCIFCSSENLYEVQRPDIEKAFGAKVYNFYGQSECVCLAGQCEQDDMLHIQSEYGYTEIVNENGQDVCGEDEIGEIVATAFNNYAMPFIRYRTGDVVISSNAKCECGRNYRLIKGVEGRKQEHLVDRNGGLATFTSSHYVLSHVKNKLFAYQYIQNEAGKVLLNIQCLQEITAEEIDKMREAFFVRYPGFELEISKVDEIERTKGGKFRFLIQNLDLNKL